VVPRATWCRWRGWRRLPFEGTEALAYLLAEARRERVADDAGRQAHGETELGCPPDLGVAERALPPEGRRFTQEILDCRSDLAPDRKHRSTLDSPARSAQPCLPPDEPPLQRHRHRSRTSTWAVR
jgi:hypothetical protein